MKGIALTIELVERRVSLNIVDRTGVKNNEDMEKGGGLEPKVWSCSANTLIAPSCFHDHIS